MDATASQVSEFSGDFCSSSYFQTNRGYNPFKGDKNIKEASVPLSKFRSESIGKGKSLPDYSAYRSKTPGTESQVMSTSIFTSISREHTRAQLAQLEQLKQQQMSLHRRLDGLQSNDEGPGVRPQVQVSHLNSGNQGVQSASAI